MNLLHTVEEIEFFENLSACAVDLNELANKYRLSEITQLAIDYRERVDEQLAKYNEVIGCKVSGKRSYGVNIIFTGTVQSISHFNAYSKSVRVNVKYDRECGGGFDGHALKDLTLIK